MRDQTFGVRRASRGITRPFVALHADEEVLSASAGFVRGRTSDSDLAGSLR